MGQKQVTPLVSWADRTLYGNLLMSGFYWRNCHYVLQPIHSSPRAYIITYQIMKTMARFLHNVDLPTNKATLAMGCFWGPDSLFGARKGVVRTRVGYAGGSKVSPTYRNLGDHTESIDIDYNPQEVSYQELLDMFWDNHDPTAKTTQQYTSLIFFHNEEQKDIAEKSLQARECKSKRGPFVTKIIPFKEFYNAEDYHQKYRLQQYKNLMEAIGLTGGEAILTSHLAARLNGYVVGFGGVQQFDEEVSSLGLDEKTTEYVRKLIIKYEGQGLSC